MASNIINEQQNARFVEETRRLYANLLTHQLDTKQLVRPTFRLMQQIVKDLIIETKLLKNVPFNRADFENADNKWDAQKRRRHRVEFMQKLVDFVANNKQPVVGCVAEKLAIGLDPVKCNELLQALARIAQSKKDATQSDSLRPRTFTITTTTTTTPSRTRQATTPTRIKRSGSKDSITRDGSRASSGGTTANMKSESTRSIVGTTNLNGNEPITINNKQQVLNLSNSPPRLATVENTSDVFNKLPTKMSSHHQDDLELVESISESDISKNLPHVRANLKQFCATLNELVRMENMLLMKFNPIHQVN